MLVNGAYMPHHDVRPQRYRLRLLNISGFRSYNLHLSNGAPLVQIATDSGLMPKPVRRRQILLGPAERVEVVVDFAGTGGESVELRSGPRGGREGAGSTPYVGALDAVPRRPRASPRPHPRAALAAAAARVDQARLAQARPHLDDLRSVAPSSRPG